MTNARTDRFFNFPVTILIFASFMLGMGEFVVVGILPDIASGLKIRSDRGQSGGAVRLRICFHTPIGSALSTLIPRFATYLILMGVFLVGNILCALAQTSGVDRQTADYLRLRHAGGHFHDFAPDVTTR